MERDVSALRHGPGGEEVAAELGEREEEHLDRARAGPRRAGRSDARVRRGRRRAPTRGLKQAPARRRPARPPARRAGCPRRTSCPAHGSGPHPPRAVPRVASGAPRTSSRGGRARRRPAHDGFESGIMFAPYPTCDASSSSESMHSQQADPRIRGGGRRPFAHAPLGDGSRAAGSRGRDRSRGRSRCRRVDSDASRGLPSAMASAAQRERMRRRAARAPSRPVSGRST